MTIPYLPSFVVTTAHISILLCSVAVYILFSKAEAIRNSKYWFFAVAGYLFSVVQIASAANILLEYYGVPAIPEEITMPVFIGLVSFALYLSIYINIYRPYRRFRKEME